MQTRRAAALWRRLWKELTVQDRKRLALAGGAMALASALMAVLPVMIGDLVDGVIHGGTVSISGAAGPLAVIASAVIAAQGLQVVRRQLVETVATSFERDARHHTYRHLLRMDLDHLRHGRMGGIYGRANRSIEGAVRLLKLGALDLLPALTLAISALIVAFTRNPLAAAAMAAVVPTGFALVHWQVANQAGVRVQLRDHKDEIDSQVVELLPALEVVRTVGADDHMSDGIHAACGRLRETELRHHRAMSLFDAAKAINEGIWLVAALGVAVRLAAAGEITAGEVTAYVLLYGGVITPLRELHRIVDEAAESAQQASDLFAFLAEPEDISYEQGKRSYPTAVAVDDPPALSLGSVRFTHVGRASPALDGVDLQLRVGERVGIVGENGCGKSTLLKLVARLHHGYDGVIRIGGRDVRHLSRHELVGMLGYVAQEPKLFRGSVLSNITLGKPSASTAEVIRAAERAHIHQDILELPAGYETIVAERGDTLSGGQRQRLCLARALLRTPPVLLLDEPTSALDGASQAAVQRAIDELTDVSILIVAHRLTTLRTMDRIVVLHAGRIIEDGAYEHLATTGGRFAALLAAQVAETDVQAA